MQEKKTSNFFESGARVWFPRPKAKTTSEALRELTSASHVSTAWLQHEMRKQVPAVERLEMDRYSWAIAVGTVAVVLLVISVLS